MESIARKKQLLDWDCQSCGNTNTVDGKPDFVTCSVCQVNQLAYQVEFREQETESMIELASQELRALVTSTHERGEDLATNGPTRSHVSLGDDITER